MTSQLDRHLVAEERDDIIRRWFPHATEVGHPSQHTYDPTGSGRWTLTFSAQKSDDNIGKNAVKVADQLGLVAYDPLPIGWAYRIIDTMEHNFLQARSHSDAGKVVAFTSEPVGKVNASLIPVIEADSCTVVAVLMQLGDDHLYTVGYASAAAKVTGSTGVQRLLSATEADPELITSFMNQNRA